MRQSIEQICEGTLGFCCFLDTADVVAGSDRASHTASWPTMIDHIDNHFEGERNGLSGTTLKAFETEEGRGELW